MSRRPFCLASYSVLVGFFSIVALGVPDGASAITTERLLSIQGGAQGDQFQVVAGIGDFNGDGYGDFAVGAPSNDDAGTDAGAVYLFFGGPGLDETADFVILGDNAFDAFGSGVCGPGDLDGDGFDDLLVGSPGYDSPATDAGRVDLFLGGPDFDGLWDIAILGTFPNDEFGRNLAGAKDVNGDGFNDFVLGSRLDDTGGADAGRAFVYWGGPLLNGGADVVLEAEAAGDRFGSVAGAGDVNGDGYADVLVGAWGTDDPGAEAGSAYVFFGGPAMDADPDRVFTAFAAGDRFGTSVSGPGDVNGDGYADILVGAWMADDFPLTAPGVAYLFYGGADMDHGPDVTYTGESGGSQFGLVTSAAGDVNGDGYPDLIIGSPYLEDDLNWEAGAAYLFHGGPGTDADPEFVVLGSESFLDLGDGVAGGTDLDGDGRDEFLVAESVYDLFRGRVHVYTQYPYRVMSPREGSLWESGGTETVRWHGRDLADIELSTDGGLTWTELAVGVGGELENELVVMVPATVTEAARLRIVYSGEPATAASSEETNGMFHIGSPPAPVAERTLIAPAGEFASDQFAGAVASAGDVNGDGFPDLVMGAPSNDAAGTDAGRVYVFFGDTETDDVADWILTGEAAGDRFGDTVCGAGDVNGDGFDDIVIGAHRHDAVATDGGRAYVFYGGSPPDVVPDVTLDGGTPGELTGWMVSGAGDMNGDGFDDVIIAAPRNDLTHTDAGVVWVLYGGPVMDGTPDVGLFGEEQADQLGWAVAGGGDFNRDGFADLLAGSYQNDAAGTNVGRAYVLLGGPNPNAVADLVLTGEAVEDWFGFRLGFAGDVNGDGSDDLIVGAKFNDEGGSNAGRAYLFLGGSRWDAVPDLIITGRSTNDNLGSSVGGAGDVNGDGYDDFLVGIPNYDAAVSNVGRVELYFGGAGMDAVPDLVWEGTTGSAFLGSEVSAAGDLTADGLGDVVLGGSNLGYVIDVDRYHVELPTEGLVWNVGSERTVAWLGAEPADLWLSVDGGTTYSLLRSGVGGSALNALALTVPHQPTRFAKIRLTPSNPAVAGYAQSDSLFTIEASIALLGLKAELVDEGGVLLSWETDPGPGDLAGYRVERAMAEGWIEIAALVRDTAWKDPTGTAGMRYRLSGINGLGETLALGEVSVFPQAALGVWPMPYRGGNLSLSFATAGGRGGGPGPVEVGIYDLSGRLVREVVRDVLPAGYRTATWDGCDATGRAVPSGVYFVQAVTGGERARLKLVVLR